jgi:hypothetical protein
MPNRDQEPSQTLIAEEVIGIVETWVAARQSLPSSVMSELGPLDIKGQLASWRAGLTRPSRDPELLALNCTGCASPLELS